MSDDCTSDGSFGSRELDRTRDLATGLAGWTLVTPDDTQCEIKLAQGATLAGRFVDTPLRSDDVLLAEHGFLWMDRKVIDVCLLFR